MQWHLEQVVDEYRDYQLDFTDVDGYGGALRLSFNLNEGTAYMTLTLDNDSGDRFVDEKLVVNSVPLEWATAVAAGVDGWTLPNQPPPLDK
jgi:hypothetical protein